MNPSLSDAGHLDGPLLEALAAGAAGEDEQGFAKRHLDVCEPCRIDLAARQAENAAFGDFFAAEEARLSNKPAAQRRERTYRFAAMVASGLAAMLAVAVLWQHTLLSGTNPNPTVAEEGKTQKPKEDPAPVTTPAPPDPTIPPKSEESTTPTPTLAPKMSDQNQEVTYQGRTAESWASDLSSTNAEQRKAAEHALEVMGADILPALLKILREGNEAQKTFVSGLLSTFNNPKATKPLLRALSDPDWRVRLAAVRGLASAAEEDPEVPEALNALQHDRDKAVVEAANRILDDVAKKQMARDFASKDLLAKSTALLKEGKGAEARAILLEGRALPGLSANARKSIDNALQQITEQSERAAKLGVEARRLMQEKKWEEALETSNRALEWAPQDQGLRDLNNTAKRAVLNAKNYRCSLDQARKELECRNWAAAIEACMFGLRDMPNDPQLTTILRQAEDGLRKEKAQKSMGVGESDLPASGQGKR